MSENERVSGIVWGEAPLLRLGVKEYCGGFLLGRSTVRGAAIMVELVGPGGSVIGHMCASLIGKPSISPEQISGFSFRHSA